LHNPVDAWVSDHVTDFLFILVLPLAEQGRTDGAGDTTNPRHKCLGCGKNRQSIFICCPFFINHTGHCCGDSGGTLVLNRTGARIESVGVPNAAGCSESWTAYHNASCAPAVDDKSIAKGFVS
jgi:hypothetical protein